MRSTIPAVAAEMPPPDPLIVVTWNVENYLAENRMVDGVYRPDYPKPEKSKAALRAVLREIQPHVVLLQEMGSGPYLQELQRDLRAEGLALPERAVVAAGDSERHLALLARVPLRRFVAHERVALRERAGGGVVRRGVLEVRVACGERELTFFAVHLKSRHSEDAGDPESNRLRAAEAEAVRDLVLRTFPRPDTAHFLLVGDCNDAPRSRPLRALQQRGETEIAILWPALDGAGDSWTHVRRQTDEYARFDYVLVSPGLARDPAVRVRAAIFDSPAVRQASDHRPIVITLERAPAKQGGAGFHARDAFSRVADCGVAFGTNRGCESRAWTPGPLSR